MSFVAKRNGTQRFSLQSEMERNAFRCKTKWNATSFVAKQNGTEERIAAQFFCEHQVIINLK